MELLLVADALEGGLGASVEAQRNRLRELGCSVRVAAPPSPRLGPDDVAVPIPAAIADIRGVRHAASVLRRAGRRRRPQLVHAHGARAFAVARLAGLRRVSVTHHGFGRGADEGDVAYAVRKRVTELLPLVAAHAFTATPELGGGWRFVPLPSPHLADLASPAPGPPDDSPPVFTWVGRLAEPKRPELFVDAVAMLAKERPVLGRIAGEGPARAAIEARIGATGAPVRLLGHVRPDLAVRDTDVVVLTSSSEGIPFSLEEAMWTARPVVASPLPGIRWLVGPDGRYAADADELADQLSALCDRGLARQEGARARERVVHLLGACDPWREILGVLAESIGP